MSETASQLFSDGGDKVSEKTLLLEVIPRGWAWTVPNGVAARPKLLLKVTPEFSIYTVMLDDSIIVH